MNRDKIELKEIARAYTEMALDALVDTCRCKDNPSARVSAAKELLDRGWGKSIQPVEKPSGPGEDATLINGTAILPPLIPYYNKPTAN